MDTEHKFKKLADVDCVEETSENTNVLVEDDGEIKRTPKSSFGTVKSVNGVEPDETGNIPIDFPKCVVQTVNGVEPDETGNVEIAMIVKSSTEGSTKRFKITVDDSGTISSTEITE